MPVGARALGGVADQRRQHRQFRQQQPDLGAWRQQAGQGQQDRKGGGGIVEHQAASVGLGIVVGQSVAPAEGVLQLVQAGLGLGRRGRLARTEGAPISFGRLGIGPHARLVSRHGARAGEDQQERVLRPHAPQVLAFGEIGRQAGLLFWGGRRRQQPRDEFAELRTVAGAPRRAMSV